jgi:hypothetical protein
MSDYDQQLADQVQMQFELDEVFKDLEEGTISYRASNRPTTPLLRLCSTQA